jgi:phosphonate transport system substrate-binding protein
MKKLFFMLSIAVLGCSFPVGLTVETPTPESTPTYAPAPTQTPLSTAEPGTERNPLILALSPSPRPSEEVIKAGDVIAAYLQSRTGYRVVTVIHPTEADLVDAFSKNNTHIAALSPYGYVLAHENNFVTALLARVRDGETFYGAQIVVNRNDGFTSYYDTALGENTADAADALKQFNERKPCWTDSVSPSGYVVPLGLLNQAEVRLRGEAFLGSQVSVVRAVYADDICDLGATFIDARDSPALEADYPDAMERVVVVWRIPAIIPYENISMASSLPFEMRRVIQRAFIDLMLTPEGKSAMQTVYGFDEVQVVEESAYAEFIAHVLASGLDLSNLIK